MLNLLQINIGECRVAHDLMMATATQIGIDIALVSEPNKALCEGLEGCFLDQNHRAAIVVTNRNLLITEVGPADNAGFRWVKVGEVRIYSVYWRPTKTGEDLNRYVDFLDRLETSVRSAEGPVVIAGDFNAKSPEWGAPFEDRNGRALTDFMASAGLVSCNRGDSPTFIREFKGGVSRTHIDVTLVSEASPRTVRDWKVRDEYTGSLHQYISFNVGISSERALQPVTPSRWAWRKFDADGLQTFLRSSRVNGATGAQSAASGLAQYLEDACNSCMPKGVYTWGKKPVYWWSQEISERRKECLAARRRCKRVRRRGIQDEGAPQRAAYKEARFKLKAAIMDSKEKCWKKLCLQVESDPWGLPYKIVTKKLVGRRKIPELSAPGRLRTIVDALFPRQAAIVWPGLESELTFPEVTREEIKNCGSTIPLGKAPGPDGVPDLVVKQVAAHRPEVLSEVFNSCFRDGIFPVNWKSAKLVLLRKGNKPLEEPSSYRPICLLNTAGKLLERVIKGRLERHLTETGSLNERQFGFRKGRSTVDAMEMVMEQVTAAGSGPLRRRQLCALVAVDVANAFNSARWDRIEDALVRKGVPEYLLYIIRSYLCDRELIFGDDERREVNCGVPQGSVLGPLLWNVMYDDLLEVDLGSHDPSTASASLIAFADDVAVIATGRNTRILEVTMDRALAAVSEWMAANGLRISTQKTEAVVLTTKRGYEEPSFTIDGEVIRPKQELKYLGIVLSRSLGYRAHLQAAAFKASNTANALARLLPNVGGSRHTKRKLLATAVHSQLLYAAPVWVGAMVFDRNVGILEGPQRTMALRVAMAYRTVSTAAALVISGMIPAHLMARERAERHKGRKEQTIDTASMRSRTYRSWQHEWQGHKKGRWTYRLIGDVETWNKRNFGNLDFHLSQLLSGHGCFGQYLHRFGKLPEAKCVDCGETIDDVEHALFRCDRWWINRRELEYNIGGTLEPDTIVQMMLRCKENWEYVRKYVHVVLSTREEEERTRQRVNVAV